MALFQKAPSSPEEVAENAPLAIPPSEVAEMNEEEWYAKAYRGENSPQLTIRAVAMGSLLGFILSFTNLYIGLKTGWHLGVALTACILSYAFWNILMKAGMAKTPMTILENNCMQSTASAAGYSTGGTFVSALAALLMLSVAKETPNGEHLPVWVYLVWTFFLAMLGVVLAIPMKRNMINQERLKFPSGTAAAVTLQSLYSEGAAAIKKARLLMQAALWSGVLKVLISLNMIRAVSIDEETGEITRGWTSLFPENFHIFDRLGLAAPGVVRSKETHEVLRAANPSDWTMVWANDPVMIAAGMLVGLRIAVWMLIGALFLIYGLGDIAAENFWLSPIGEGFQAIADAAALPTADSEQLGAMLTQLAVDFPAATSTIDGIRTSTNLDPVAVQEQCGAFALSEFKSAATHPGKAWKEIGIWFGVPIMVASGLLAFAFQWRTIGRAFSGMFASRKSHGAGSVTGTGEVPTSWFVSGLVLAGAGVIAIANYQFDIPIVYGIVAVALTFVLALVACRATGESDITPTGAMGKIMQLTFGVLMPQSTTANLMSAGITAGAASSSADLLNDLKSGYLLGANPKRQFVAQFMGIFAGTCATVLGFMILVPDVWALMPKEMADGTLVQPEFAAPAAQSWMAVAEVFKLGLENMHPMHRSAIQVGLGLGVIFLLLETFLPKAKKWLPSATGFGLGLILPFEYPLSMFVGALIAHFWMKRNKKNYDDYMIPMSAGIIAGVSIIGVIVAILNIKVFG